MSKKQPKKIEYRCRGHVFLDGRQVSDEDLVKSLTPEQINKFIEAFKNVCFKENH